MTKLRKFLNGTIVEYLHYVNVILRDVISGKKYWISVTLTLLGLILAASAITMYTPRLTLSVNVDREPEYSVDDGKTYSRKESLYLLDKTLKTSLESNNTRLFSLGAHLDFAPEDSKTSIEQQIKELKVLMPRTRVPMTITVGNIGLLASTLTRITTIFVEEIDGRRSPIAVNTKKLSVKLDQGATIVLDKQSTEEIETIENAGAWQFVGYEIFHSLDAKARVMYPDRVAKDRYIFNLIGIYRNILPPWTNLEPMASKSHTAQIIANVYVFDIYGRTATTEALILDSSIP